MKYEAIYERRKSADHLGAVLLPASVAGIATAVVGSSSNFIPRIGVLLLSLVAFALFRLFDLLGEVLSIVGRLEETSAAAGNKPAPPSPPTLPGTRPPFGSATT